MMLFAAIKRTSKAWFCDASMEDTGGRSDDEHVFLMNGMWSKNDSSSSSSRHSQRGKQPSLGKETDKREGGKAMYGDFVNGLCYTAFLPAYIYLWKTIEIDPLDENGGAELLKGPRNIVLAFAWTTVFSWISYFHEVHSASVLALVGMSASIAGMNIYRWPHEDEVIVLPQFIWSLLIISANQPLNVEYRIVMAAIALVNAIIVCIIMSCPEKLPILVAVLAPFGLYQYHLKKEDMDGVDENRSMMKARLASLILAAAFAYDASYEVVAMYSQTSYASGEGHSGYKILRLGFFAVAGLSASGSFRREIEFKEALEVLVEQRSAELRRQTQQLQVVEHAMQHSETAIAITDKNHCIIWCNVALEKLLEMTASQLKNSRESLLSCLKAKLQSSDDALLLEQLYLGVVTQSGTGNITINNRHLEIDISPYVPDEDEEDGDAFSPRYLVVLKDVTERCHREKAEKEAEKKAVQSQAMVESMQTLSHELRTPLQAIMGMTSLLLDDPTLPKDAHEPMLMVLTSSRLLLTLINNILDRRMCDTGHMNEFQLSPLNVGSSLRDAQDFCRPFAKISDVDLTFNVKYPNPDDASVYAKSNALRFQQIMINLISNSIKHSPRGSAVSVTAEIMTVEQATATLVDTALAVGTTPTTPTHPPKTMVAVVAVSDQGRGIPQDQKDLVFRRFAQLDVEPVSAIGGKKNSSQPSGTGLGLNLCTEFVSRMGGLIWANNNTNNVGACFAFYLPLSSPPPAPPASLTDSIDNQDQSKCSITGLNILASNQITPRHPAEVSGRFRILVVDDTLINLKVLSRMLSKQTRVDKICTAGSGVEALQCLEKDKEGFNLVITDIQMPQMDGIELCERILKRKFVCNPPVVGLTADTSATIEELCLKSGMKQVLHKPLTHKGLSDFFKSMANRVTA